MNIIDINYKKLRDSVNDYILANSEDMFSQNLDVHINIIRPIILMNEETLKFLNEKNYIINNSKKNFSMIFDCYIAIANWLPFGEVELK